MIISYNKVMYHGCKWLQPSIRDIKNRGRVTPPAIGVISLDVNALGQ